jgi:hypothetical protein
MSSSTNPVHNNLSPFLIALAYMIISQSFTSYILLVTLAGTAESERDNRRRADSFVPHTFT